MDPSDYAHLQATFNYMDKNKDGKISITELKDALKVHDIQCDEKSIERVVGYLDSNKDGEISFNEFAAILKANSSPTEKAKKLFYQLDVNKDGKISAKELLPLAKKLKLTYTDAELQSMITTYDQNGDGFLSFEEFYKIVEDC